MVVADPNPASGPAISRLGVSTGPLLPLVSRFWHRLGSIGASGKLLPATLEPQAYPI